MTLLLRDVIVSNVSSSDRTVHFPSSRSLATVAVVAFVGSTFTARSILSRTPLVSSP